MSDEETEAVTFTIVEVVGPWKTTLKGWLICCIQPMVKVVMVKVFEEPDRVIVQRLCLLPVQLVESPKYRPLESLVVPDSEHPEASPPAKARVTVSVPDPPEHVGFGEKEDEVDVLPDKVYVHVLQAVEKAQHIAS